MIKLMATSAITSESARIEIIISLASAKIASGVRSQTSSNKGLFLFVHIITEAILTPSISLLTLDAALIN